MKRTIVSVVLIFAVRLAFCQDGRDRFSIPWPEQYHWRIYDRTTGLEINKIPDRDFIYNIQVIPGSETLNNWTIIGSVTKYTRTTQTDLKMIADSIFAAIQKISSKARFKLIEEDEFYIIFKTESILLKDDTTPQSKLYYIMDGAWDKLYVSNITIKKAVLSDEFTAAWTKVFKARKYYFW